MNGWKRWLIIFGAVNFAALFSFSIFLSGSLMESSTVPYIYFLINELTGFNAVLPLLPFVIRFIDRFPLTRGTWYYRLFLHFGFSMVFGVVLTVLVTVSRTWIYYWLDLGPYDLGEPFYRFVMEYHKQLLSYMLIYGIVRFNHYYRGNREKEKQASRLELQAERLKGQLSQIQLETLKQQIQPHFLFNTLNMISSLMYDDVEKADRMMAALSDLLRMSLDRSASSKVTLKEEISFTKRYLEIMQARFEDHLQVEFSVDPGMETYLVPNLILQPLVENCIKHNPVEESPIALVRVSARRDNGDIQMSVEDNGPGLNGEADLSAGIGLRNTLSRMEQLYGENGGIKMENLSPRGLRVQLNFPAERI